MFLFISIFLLLRKYMALVMSTSMITSSHRWYQLPCLHASIILLLFFTIFHTNIVSCSETQVSYSSTPCASIVHESTPKALEFTTLPFQPDQNGYFYGGDKILNQNPSPYSSRTSNIFLFQTQHVYTTEAEGVFKVEGMLILDASNMNYVSYSRYGQSVYSYPMTSEGGLRFKLQGFWSESTGKLCMVGSSSRNSQEGNKLDLTAVLKLSDVKSTSNITSLVRGTLESLGSHDDSSYFDSISLLIFPQTNYQYTEVSKEFNDACAGGIDVPESLSLKLSLSETICSILSMSMNAFELEYASGCDSGKSCNPFGEGIGYLPRFMSLNSIQCSQDRQSLRLLVEFPNSSYVGFYRDFNPNTTFIGEGSWDGKKNRLCVVACRFLNAGSSWDNSHVGDCSLRLSLRFPAILSIRNTSSIVGQIWSNRSVNDPGFFKRIMFQGSRDNMNGIPGLEYNYTEIDRVRKLCSKKKPVKNKHGQYPDGQSSEMQFDMSVKNSTALMGWGNSGPVSVGNQIFQWNRYSMSFSSSRSANSVVEANTSSTTPMNISYKMSLTLQPGVKWGGGISPSNTSSDLYMTVDISAEGLYDAETGGLCMVGCKYLGSSTETSKNDSMDCEILINLQFPPLNQMESGGRIKGSIESTRNKYDPHYFEPLRVSATAFYWRMAGQTIWRMDLEIILALLSNTLACAFVGFQLWHLKRHHDVLPFISLIMLVILTLGYMIPLVLNFEALFLKKHNRRALLLRTGGWLEVNEVIVRVVTMVAFLLQFRLLQQTWCARFRDGNQKALWIAEKKALYVSLPLYIAGGLIALFVNLRRDKFGKAMHSSYSNGHQQFLWEDLKSYAGLVLDGFLLPQILINIFQNSKQIVLSPLFYFGTTFVRLLPHAYDLYRTHSDDYQLDWSYIYADPSADFYSTAWDVIIPLGGLLFAAVIYFQQRFGGRCFLPRRCRELEPYEKIPLVSEA